VLFSERESKTPATSNETIFNMADRSVFRGEQGARKARAREPIALNAESAITQIQETNSDTTPGS